MSNLVTTEALRLTTAEIAELAAAGIIPADCPPAQVAIFAGVCKSVGLDPRLKEIELIPLGNGKYAPYLRKDGLRKVAARTGEFAGFEPIKFDLMPDGSYRTAASYPKGHKPTTATATVWRFVKGHRCPFTVTVVTSEFDKGRGQWGAMPIQMISKVAEAHALRMAFPEVGNGILCEGEIEVAQEIATGVPAAPGKSTLVIGTEKFRQVVAAVATDKATLQQAEAKFNIDEPTRMALIDAINEYQQHIP